MTAAALLLAAMPVTPSIPPPVWTQECAVAAVQYQPVVVREGVVIIGPALTCVVWVWKCSGDCPVRNRSQ